MPHPLASARVLLFSLLLLTLASPLLRAAPEFVAPTEQERSTALGKTETLDPALRRLFQDTAAFSAIPEPGPLDWLSTRYEAGQTYDQFYASDIAFPDPEHPYLYLQPICSTPLPQDTIDLLATYCSAFFNTEVKLLDPMEIDPNRIRTRKTASSGEEQLHAKDILKALDLNRPKDAYAIIAFTYTDLYPDESWNFVFGLADLRRSVGVFSFARYGSAESALFDERALKVMSHEICHMYGLKHCTYYHCLMNGSNSLEETDRAPMHLCPVCLRKLHASTKLDPLTRYAKLKNIYENLEITPAEAFAQSRISLLLESALR